MFHSLRIYFINTSWPFFCHELQMPVGMPPLSFLLACLMVCKHKPIPLRCFSRLHFQASAWDARLWWWAMCKAAFSNLIKALRYSPLKQRALEAWRNDSGKSTALICKNLHLLAGRGNARRRGRGERKASAFRVVALIELQKPNPKLWHPNVLSQTDLAWSRGLREGVKTRKERWRGGIEWSSVLDTTLCQREGYQVLLQPGYIGIFYPGFCFSSFQHPPWHLSDATKELFPQADASLYDIHETRQDQEQPSGGKKSIEQN